MTSYAKVEDGIVIAVIQSCPAGSESQLSEMGWRACSDATKPRWIYNEKEVSFYPPTKETSLPRNLIVRWYAESQTIADTGKPLIADTGTSLIIGPDSLAQLWPDMDAAFPCK